MVHGMINEQDNSCQNGLAKKPLILYDVEFLVKTHIVAESEVGAI